MHIKIKKPKIKYRKLFNINKSVLRDRLIHEHLHAIISLGGKQNISETMQKIKGISSIGSVRFEEYIRGTIFLIFPPMEK